MRQLINKRELIIVAVIGILLFAFGAKFDLDIAKSIQNATGFKGIGSNIAAIVGEIPTYAIGVFVSVSYIYLAPKNSTKFRYVITKIFGYAGVLVATFFTAKTIKDSIEFMTPDLGKWCWIIGIVAAVIVSALVVFFTIKRHNTYDQKNYFFVVNILFILIVGELVLMTILKYLWSRPRPFQVLVNGVDFKSVFELNPLKCLFDKTADDFKSFPSSHVSSVIILAGITPYLHELFPSTKGNRKMQVSMFYIFIVLGLLMALSRMIIGEHYMSDIAGGILIALLMIFLTDLLFSKIQIRKKFIKE